MVNCAHKEPAEKVDEGKKLNQFFEDQFEANVSRYPTWQTYLGRKTNYDKLDNETLEYAEAEHQNDRDSLNKLRQFNYNALSEADKISYKIYEYQLEQSLEGHKWRYHSFPLNQMFGYQAQTPAFLINMHRISSESDALAYISRLAEIKSVFDERMIFLKQQEDIGVYPPKFVFEKVITDSKNIIKNRPFEKNSKVDSTLLSDFRKKVSKLEILESKKNELIQMAE